MSDPTPTPTPTPLTDALLVAAFVAAGVTGDNAATIVALLVAVEQSIVAAGLTPQEFAGFAAKIIGQQITAAQAQKLQLQAQLATIQTSITALGV